jgi:hypothetical protein
VSNIQLTPAQHAILAYALEHTSGKIEWFPDNIKGGARKKVLESLFNRALITRLGDDWLVAAEGYDAMGRARPAPDPVPTPPPEDPEMDAVVAAAEAQWSKDGAPEQAQGKPRTRENSKQASIIEMLKRPEGATIAQIVALTGWQAHTVRGTFAGAFKKKLGLTVVSEKAKGEDRVYRIA